MTKFAAAACAALALVFALLGSHGALAITGGSGTTVQLHPYQVAVDQIPHPDDDDPIEGGLMCSGVLVGKRTVATAISCFGEDIIAAAIQVRVGALFREGGGEIYNVTDIVTYPDYNVYGGYDDVALLFLDEEVTERAEVKPIALANPNLGFDDGDTVVITGYGDLYEDEVTDADEPRQLQAVSLPIFNYDLCSNLYWFTQYDTRQCAGGAGRGTCGKRDIGSPVVNSLGELVGMTLLQRRGCGILGEPTVFQNLLDADVWAWVTDNIDNPPAPKPVPGTTPAP